MADQELLDAIKTLSQKFAMGDPTISDIPSFWSELKGVLEMDSDETFYEDDDGIYLEEILQVLLQNGLTKNTAQVFYLPLLNITTA